MIPGLILFSDAIKSRGSGSHGLSQSEWHNEGKYPVIGQGASYIEGWTNRDDLVIRPNPSLVLYGGHTRRAKYVDQPFVPGPNVKILEAKIKTQIDHRYLFYFLSNLQIKSRGYADHFPEVKRCLIPIQALDDQKRIAHLLGKVECLIDRRKHHQQQLDNLLKSVFLEMFWDYIRAKKETDLGSFIVTLTDYHANGSYETLKKHVELLTESNYALMVRTTDLEKNNFSEGCNYITEDAYNFLDKSKVFGGEIIVNKIGSAGKVYLMPYLNRPVSLGMNAFLIRFNKDLNSIFAYYFLTSNIGTQRIQKLVKGAVTKTITKNAIRSIAIPEVPINSQNHFAAIVEKVESLKFRYQHSLTDLETLYGALSQKAFKGELDLSRVPLPVEEFEQAVIEDVETKIQTDIEENHQRAPLSELVALTFVEGRKALLDQLLPTWFDQLGGTPFSAQHFMAHVEQRAADLIDAQDSDARFVEHEDVQFGPAEYDHLKTRVFEAMEQGRLTQGYDDANNRVQVRAAKE